MSGPEHLPSPGGDRHHLRRQDSDPASEDELIIRSSQTTDPASLNPDSAARLPQAVLHLQRIIGNQAVQRLVERAGRTTSVPMPITSFTGSGTPIQRALPAKFKKKENLEYFFGPPPYKDLPLLKDPQRAFQEIKTYLEGMERGRGMDQNVQELAGFMNVEVEKPPERVVEEEVGERVPFISLDDDVEHHRYTLQETGGAKIRYKSAESEFEDYSGGKSVKDAVEEAIESLDVRGDSKAPHSRHDFQPTGSERENLQVQLGGSSGSFRRGKGDTSSTLVVVNAGFFRLMVETDPVRWRLVLQTAHRLSFANSSKIEIGPPA